MNLDIVMAMPCKDLHVNVQDAAMDHILAGNLLSKDDTNWEMWLTRPPTRDLKDGYTSLNNGGGSGNTDFASLVELKRKRKEAEDSHVGHVLGHMREGGRKFVKTPRLKRSEPVNACRIYGSLEGNKVQGDFHITARGHGYQEMRDPNEHLVHSTFNFSHHINELSFGPHYPSLLNPLDRTSDTTPHHFYKFQYYLSIVPTIFTKRRVSTASGTLDPAAVPQPATLDLQPELKKRGKDGAVHHVANPSLGRDSQSVFTNQYAATSQSREVPEKPFPGIPGVFFKYDIEPILLIVSEQRGSFLGLVVRLVNVISGVLVGGGWAFQLSEWLVDFLGRRRRRGGSGPDYGVLHGRSDSKNL